MSREKINTFHLIVSLALVEGPNDLVYAIRTHILSSPEGRA